MPRFWVRLTPRAAAERIDGVDGDGILRVRVRAAPADGAANEALMRLLGRALAVPPTDLRIAAGTTARRKLIELADEHRDRLAALWPGLLR